MGFLDKAKAAASDLASKADTALSNAGLGVPGAADADKLFKDLGRLSYLESTGRPVDTALRDQLLASLSDLEGKGAMQWLTGPTGAPPPPGAAQAPPPPGGYGAPPAPGAVPPPPGSASPAPNAEAPPAAPPAAAPPPPSWASGDQG